MSDTPRERPSTEEQQRRRELNRCRNLCPPVESMFAQASGRQCIRKGGHEGPCMIDFGWSRYKWWPK